MFKIACIDHLVLRTNQLEEMLHFYCGILNCKVERVQEQIGLTQLRAGDSVIDLIVVEHPLAKDHRNLEHFCLRISPFNFVDLEKYFNERGVEILRYGERYSAQGYDNSFYLRDPEDNEVELTKSNSG